MIKTPDDIPTLMKYVPSRETWLGGIIPGYYSVTRGETEVGQYKTGLEALRNHPDIVNGREE